MENEFDIIENIIGNLKILSNLAIPLIVINNNDIIEKANSPAVVMFDNIYMNENIHIIHNEVKNVLWFIEDEYLSFKNGTTDRFVFEKKIKKGNILWKFNGILLKIKYNIVLMINYHLDIPQALLLTSIVNSSEDAIIGKTLDGKVISWNKAAERIYGYTKEEALGRDIFILGLDNSEKEAAKYSEKLCDGKEFKNIEIKRLSKKNEEIHLSVNLSPIKGYNGQVIGICAIARDITENKKLQKEFLNSEKRFRSIYEQSPIGIELFDANGEAIEANTSFCNMFKIDNVKDFKFSNFFKSPYIDEESKHKIINNKISRVTTEFSIKSIKNKKPSDNNIGNGYRIKKHYFDILTTPILNEQGKLVSILCQVQDMTNIRDTQKMVKNFTSLSNHMFCIINYFGNFIEVSPSVERVLGWRKKEFQYKNFKTFLHKDDLKIVNDAIVCLSKMGNMVIRSRYKCKDGTYKWVEWSCFLVKEDKLVYVVGRDITKRTQAEEELRKARFSAIEANKSKDRFLANMSHEIRTPINGIMGMTDLTLMTELTDEQSEYLNIIKDSCEHLLDIVNDILDIAKIESGKFKLDLVPFNLQELIDKLISNFSILAHKKFIKVIHFLDPAISDINLIGDPLRLNQILINLLNNALKFTPRGNIIVCAKKISAPVGKIKIQFSVQDTGIGIPENKLDKLFKNFSQLDDSYTKKYGGTGLGLAICKNLVTMMNGTIWVTSTENEGSCFYFTAEFLPLNTDLNNDTIENTAIKDTVLLNKTFNNINENIIHKQDKLILIADDNDINKRFVSTLLDKKGYNYISASNGNEVLELLERFKVDLILMDIQMPKLNGLDATQTIRNIEKFTGNHIPIIAMTAYAMVGDKEKFLSMGMDNYISKPIDIIKLYELIMKYLD